MEVGEILISHPSFRNINFLNRKTIRRVINRNKRGKDIVGELQLRAQYVHVYKRRLMLLEKGKKAKAVLEVCSVWMLVY